MKKILVVAIVVAMALVGANIAMATIAGSKHDLTSATYYTGGTSISSCAYCHTPHHAVGTAAPLWNRRTPAGPYTVYGNGSTLSGQTVNATPGANSLTCLSCHDGTIALGDIVNGTGTTVAAVSGNSIVNGFLTAGNAFIGTDLRTTHPVGVSYNTARTIAGLNTTITVNAAGTGATIGGKNWKIYGGGNNAGTVECGSCHDPHNTTAGQTPFLKDTKATICSDCHSNK